VRKNELWTRLLEPSLGYEQADYFLRFVAACLASFTSWKLFLMIVGSSNSGKIILTTLVDTAFATLTATFNRGNLTAKGNGINDSEKAQSWLHELRHARVLLANEIMNGGGKVGISGTALKQVASREDTIKGRENYSFAREFKLPGPPILMCNDRPRIKPLDSGVANRFVELRMPHQFLGQEALEHEPHKGKCNVSLANKGIQAHVESERAQAALTSLVLDAFPPERLTIPQCVLEQTRRDIEGEDTITRVRDMLVEKEGAELPIDNIKKQLEREGTLPAVRDCASCCR
jgi:phage/plasmid-associated DNA primase